MELKKNAEVEVVIEDLSSTGEGIGKVDGYPLFIKEALVGEHIRCIVMKMKKKYGYARIKEILVTSTHRVTPKCEKARRCGGCQLQHMDYEMQLEFKRRRILNCLNRIAGLQDAETYMEPMIGMDEPYYYRNKAQFPVSRNMNGEIITGFYAERSHNVTDISHCCLQMKGNDEWVRLVKEFIVENRISVYDEGTHTGLVRHIMTRVGFATGEIMVCLVINGKSLPEKEKLIGKLKDIPGMTSICLNVNMEKTNVIMGEKVESIWGKGYITDRIGDIGYQISPLSFYQINPMQTRKLYEVALEYAGLTGNEVVWDLYCGIGTISLFLAQKAKQVFGVEIVPQAVADARKNAELNGITNAEFFVGAAEDVVAVECKKVGRNADVVVVDPPRKGCDLRLLETIVRMEPEKVVYVSCDPGTLARDLKYLGENGYKVKRWRGVDQFGQNFHVECVVLMSRVRK